MRSHFLRATQRPLIFVGSASAAQATNGTYTINVGSLTGGAASSPGAGDIIVICNGATATSDVTFQAGVVTSGFTQLTALYADDTRDANMWVSYKIAAGSEGNITLNSNNTSNNLGNAAVAHVWRNINATPIDVTTTTATGTNSARPNVPSVTPVTAGAVILGFGYGTQGATSGAFTASGLSYVATGNVDAASGGASCIVAAFTGWTSGAYNMAAFTGGESSLSDSWCAAAVVLRPR